MKKLAALILTVIGITAFAIGGCSGGDTFTQKSYSGGENEIAKVTVQVEDRELEVSSSEDNRVYIDYFDGEKEYLDINTERGELTVKLTYNKQWTDFIGVKPSAEYRKIIIRLPDNFMTAFSASTSNGNIKMNDLSVKENVCLNSNGGDVLCERLNVGKAIGLTAKNGNIAGSVIGGWDDFSISCKIKKGESNLPAIKESGEKFLSADCNNGDINIEFIK